MMKEIVIIGAGGHAKACIDVIEQENKFKICGIIDNIALSGGMEHLLNYPIIGKYDKLYSLFKIVKNAFIALGQIKTPINRISIFNELMKIGYNLPTIISPIAYIARDVSIGEGSIIMHNAIINTSAKIGKMCIINSKALIEHDSIVEDFCHLSTCSVINGGCIVKEGSFIGSNMVLKHKSTVNKNSVLYFNPLENNILPNNVMGGGNKKRKLNVFTLNQIKKDQHLRKIKSRLTDYINYHKNMNVKAS